MSAAQNQYGIGLDKTPANFVALTPLSFLARTAAVYPDHISAVHEARVFTWSQTHERCRRFAAFLAGQGTVDPAEGEDGRRPLERPLPLGILSLAG